MRTDRDNCFKPLFERMQGRRQTEPERTGDGNAPPTAANFLDANVHLSARRQQIGQEFERCYQKNDQVMRQCTPNAVDQELNRLRSMERRDRAAQHKQSEILGEWRKKDLGVDVWGSNSPSGGPVVTTPPPSEPIPTKPYPPTNQPVEPVKPKPQVNFPTDRIQDSDPTQMQKRRSSVATSMIKEIQKIGNKKNDDDVEAFARRQEALYRAEQEKEKRTGGTAKKAPVERAIQEEGSKRGAGIEGHYAAPSQRSQPRHPEGDVYAGSPAGGPGSTNGTTQHSLLPEDDPLPPIPAQRLPASSDFGDSGGQFSGESYTVAAYSPPNQYNEYERKKKQEEEELRGLPEVQLNEPETGGKPRTAESKKEEKEEKGFFGKLSDKIFNFFGFGGEEENTSRTPEDVLAEKQFDPLANPEEAQKKAAGKKEKLAEETLKSEKWFGKEKEHNPDAKPENTEAYKVADPVFEEGKEPKIAEAGADEKIIEKQNRDLPVIVLSGQPQFDPTKVADQIHEIEKTEVKRSMASKSLEELAQEASLLKAVPLEDTYIEDAQDEFMPAEDLSGLGY